MVLLLSTPHLWGATMLVQNVQLIVMYSFLHRVTGGSNLIVDHTMGW